MQIVRKTEVNHIQFFLQDILIAIGIAAGKIRCKVFRLFYVLIYRIDHADAVRELLKNIPVTIGNSPATHNRKL